MWNVLQRLVVSDKFSKAKFDTLTHLLDSQTVHGTSILHFAAIGSSDMVKYVLKHNANPNHQNEDGTTPMHWAVRHGKLDNVKLLIDYNAVVDLADDCGDSPLHWAAEYDKEEIAEYLMDHGARPGRKNFGSETPIDIAKQNDSRKMVHLLQQHKTQQENSSQKDTRSASCASLIYNKMSTFVNRQLLSCSCNNHVHRIRI